MSDNSLDRAELRRLVEAEIVREKRRARAGMLIASLLMYLVFMVLCVGFILTRSDSWTSGQTTVVALLITGWTTSILFQLITTLIDYKPFYRTLRQRAIGKAVEHEIMGESGTSKAKRKREAIVSLSDDGELVFEDAAQEKKQNGLHTR
jgi:hypothetical protein